VKKFFLCGVQEYIPNWSGIVDSDFSDRLNDVRIIGCTTIVLILILAFVGMDWVTRVSLFMFSEFFLPFFQSQIQILLVPCPDACTMFA
jgi:hypothetical protein